MMSNLLILDKGVGREINWSGDRSIIDLWSDANRRTRKQKCSNKVREADKRMRETL